MREQAFRTPERVTLSISVPAGEIEIETADVEETRVVLEPFGDDERNREAIETAQIELREREDGSEVVVAVEQRTFLFVSRSPEVRVYVRCPEGAMLRIQTVAADVRARGTFGAADVKTTSGDVALGSIVGPAGVKSVSGDVGLESVEGTATVQSVSGDVRIDRASGEVETRTVSGDVRIGEAASSVHAHTISGDVRVAAASEGTVECRTTSGDVEVGIRPGSRVWVDASSMSGDARSELELGDTPPDGEGPLVELRVNALSGDIRVRRALA